MGGCLAICLIHISELYIIDVQGVSHSSNNECTRQILSFFGGLQSVGAK